MDCVREAENYLRYYRDLKKSIEHAESMIVRLKWRTAPKDDKAVTIDITGIRANKPINTLNQFYQLQKWQEIQERTQVEIDKVDDVLDSICVDPGCERYKEFLVMWYVEKLDKDYIAKAMGYSHRQSVYELRGRAIRKFAVSLFGVEALQAI